MHVRPVGSHGPSSPGYRRRDHPGLSKDVTGEETSWTEGSPFDSLCSEGMESVWRARNLFTLTS